MLPLPTTLPALHMTLSVSILINELKQVDACLHAHEGPFQHLL